ncbi:FkbM family methyltransferase [Planktothrix pseudagardhii]|uniref:Glycosyltransferase family 92 protein RCOM_0530710 n=1 Tax=Planktothrix pseudagardhii TaxID=132604 RepID=A0A9W4G6T9_9CYAN|nr:FkbM family methyltransferase [Planktothrix pseudagardhii]CAD5948853.1 Glycosyltransferase family 92 protein RCOM_0530710 [Planktothrix pseudagardhii]
MGLGNCQNIMALLQKEYQIKTFIETGTFQGTTAVWASEIFNNVFTIELSQHLYESTVRNYGHIANINFCYGHTKEHLKSIVPQLNGSSLFWLDAHWSEGITAGQEDPCPLLEELKIIKNSQWEHFIFIDDARLFLSPPPHPHGIDRWPAIHTIVQELLSLQSPYIVVIEDAIISVPEYARTVLAEYCQNGNTKAWEQYMRNPKRLFYPISFENQPEQNLIEEQTPVADEVEEVDFSFQQSGESQVIQKFIQPGSIVFDLGANLGHWTQEVLRNSTDPEIHLFEALPNNYNTLIKNLASKFKNSRIIPNSFAISSQPGIQTFYHYLNHPALSTFHRRISVENIGILQYPQEIKILRNTIDNYCYQQQIKRINFIKIDVSGHELEVLRGAEIYLSKGKIDYLQFEYGGTYLDAKTTLKEVFSYLQSFRYSIFKILPDRLHYLPNFKPEYENYEGSNFLAVNERFQANLLGQAAQMLDLKQLCHQYSITPRGVVHVGAHEGTEISSYQAMGVQKVLFIEANPAVFERLQANVAAYPNVQAVNCAISNQNGMINLRVTSFDQSSSILPLKHHQNIYPDIVETHQVTVEAKTLDTLLQELGLNPSDFNILNIDIQGAELLALQGATHWLTYIEAINTEVNYKQLYEGSALIDDLDEFLDYYGFNRVKTVTHHPDWGDAFYVKKPVITMSAFEIARFGNQIFDYAFLKIYAQTHDLHLEIPRWVGHYLFGHQESQISRQLPDAVEHEQSFEGSEMLILNSPTPLKNVDVRGYFQLHTQYYSKYQNWFRSWFHPVSSITEKMEEAMNRLRAKGKTIVGLHLRRGDYSWACHHVPYLRIAPSEWYREWLKGLWETLEQPVLFIASDEIENVVGDFVDYNPVTIQDLGVELPLAPFYPEFYILSQCDILAISNSTFSFAASMLNERCKFFFRPHLKYKKLIPYDPWNSEPLLRDNPDQIISRKKCTLSVCAILKDEAPYLIEWLEFHKLVGVERFYLYDNGSSDHVIELVKPYIQSGEVIWHEWLIRPGQIPAYQDCLDKYKTESQWIAFIDLDEFLVPTEKNDIKAILEDFQDYPGVTVNWLIFGSSGHKIKPEGLQVENFTRRGEDGLTVNFHVKSIVQPEKTLKVQDPHCFIYVNNQLAVTENKEPMSGPFSPSHSAKQLVINHYIIKSLQEYKEKMFRGRSDTEQPRNWMFEAADQNNIEDLTIQRFVPELKKAVESVISQSPIAQILQEQWRLKTELYKKQTELELWQNNLKQTQELNSESSVLFQQELENSQTQLKRTQDQLNQAQSELNQIREELERAQAQFDEVLAELEEAHWQLNQHQQSKADQSALV